MKNVKYLIEYCKKQIDRPYWCGTFGQIANDWLYHYNKGRLPMFYTANDFQKQYGQKVHDCIGLIKGAMWCETPDSVPVYVPSQDVSVQGMYQIAAKKGTIKDTKTALKNGTLLFNKSFGHVGVLIDGYVYNAKGHAYGVCKDAYIKGNWAYWCECPFFDYSEEVKPITKPLQVGDEFTLATDATIYNTSRKFADFVYNMPCYVQEINGNRVVFTCIKGGATTGATHKKYCIN